MKTLERRLGVASVIAIGTAAMLGGGLFVLPGIAAGMTGPSLWLAYAAAGLCVLPTALSKAELATAMPESGGTYVYIDRTFGPLAGTVVGVGLWLSLLLKSAFALVGFSAYLNVLADVPREPLALLLLLVVLALNLLGVRKVGKVQAVVVVIAVVSLTLLAAESSLTVRSDYMVPLFAHGVTGFWATVGFVFVSFAGVTKVAAIAEEVENPSRNLPIGMLASLGLVTALYAAITFTLVGNIPVDQLHGDLRPLHTLAHKVAGHDVGVAIALVGVFTMTAMANSGLLAASRFPFAMSRAKLMPSFLSYISSRLMTPIWSILATASLMGASIVLLDLERIAKLASALMLVGFLAVNLAVLVLRESAVPWYKPVFRSPSYPYVQLVGVLVNLGLLFTLGPTGLLAVAAAAIPGLVLFFGFGRQHTDRVGVLGRLGPRRELLAEDHAPEHIILPSKAAVVVPILGRGRGAEALAELGDALGGGAKVEVLHITNLPEQIALDTRMGVDPVVNSLKRRITALAEQRNHDIEFDAIATHDHVRVVHEISRRVHSEWVLMGWRSQNERGVLPSNPLGWLTDNLSCNLAFFKDVGSRTVKKILVYAEPGPHDALVAITADHLARTYKAELTFTRHVDPRASDDAVEKERAYLRELASLCKTRPNLELAHGPDAAEAVSALTSDHDLLVMTSPPELRFWGLLRQSRSDRIMRRSACSVLRLKAPRMLADRTLGREVVPEGSELHIDDFVLGECLEVGLPTMGKPALFRHFAERFASAIDDVSVEMIEESLWERERAQSTAIGNGLAVPHGNLTDLKRTYAGVFTTSGPIDYRAPDGVPVDVFFVTLGPPAERNTHLKLLAVLARLVLNTPFLERIRVSDNASELSAVLMAAATLQRSSYPPAPPAAAADGDAES